MNTELPVLGIGERTKAGRSDVRLHVAGEERVQRVHGADSQPRLPFGDRDAPLEPDVETEVGREALRVASTNEFERLVDDRVRQPAAPVEGFSYKF